MCMIKAGHPEIQKEIHQNIQTYNEPFFSKGFHQELFYYISDENEALIAGITGEIFDHMAEIHFLWVDTTCRTQGFGKKLLHHFEQQAMELGATSILVDTFDFQAPLFYEKNGYTLLAKTAADYLGASKNFYQKALTPKITKGAE